MASIRCANGHSWDVDLPIAGGGDTLRCPTCGTEVNLDGTPEVPTAAFEPRAAPTGTQYHDRPTTTIIPGSATQPSLAAPGLERKSVPGYEILGELGRGGMGVVYKARHQRLKRLVALKMILAGAHASAGELARFRAEAEAIAQFGHPNIVQVYETGEHDGLPYLSLEYCAGGSLDRKLGGTPLPARQAAELVATLAKAISIAHVRGIVHRDLKPANVLLSEEGTPKISDFGLAKRLEQEGITQVGSILGTPSYMAPEQAAGNVKEVGPAADIYALGALLYRTLTGRPPFHAPTSVETVMQVLHDEPVPPRHLQSAVPADLETICLKCLAKDPQRRYASAQALADDLERFLTDRPIVARPASLIERGWRWCRRNPRLAVMNASVAFLLIVITVISSAAAWLLQQERDQVVSHRSALEETNRQLRIAQEEEKKAREDAVEKLFKSYLAQARARRWSGQAGRRFDGLDVLAKAAAIHPTRECRNEAIACMALVDLRIGKEWDGCPPGTTYVAFDAELARYARCDDKGNVSVRRVGDDTEVVSLAGPGSRGWDIQFDASQRYLAGKFHPPGGDASTNNRLIVWDLQDGKRVLELSNSLGSFTFAPEPSRLAVGFGDHSVRFFNLASGKETGDRLPIGAPPHYLAFQPVTPHHLAVSSQTGGVRVMATDSGKIAKVYSPALSFRGIAWHPHGKLLAGCGMNSKIYVWNVDAGVPHAILEGLQNTAMNVIFNRAGNLLASTGWDSAITLWDAHSGKMLVRFGGTLMHHFPRPAFSADDRLLAHNIHGAKIQLLEVANAPESRTLYARTNRIGRMVDLSADGRYMASPEADGVDIWDVQSYKIVAHAPGGSTYSALFLRDGKHFITSSDVGVQRWSIDGLGAPAAGALELGPAQDIAKGKFGFSTLSADGRYLATQEVTSGQVTVFNLEAANGPTLLKGHPNARFLTVSHNGDRVATGTWHGFDVKVWDLKSAKPVHIFAGVLSANTAFSPNGEWLFIGTGGEGRLWKTGTWTPGPWVYRNRDGDVPSALAFAPRGDMLAVNHPRNLTRLLDPQSGDEIAVLEPIPQREIGQLCFDGSGSRIAAADESQIQVWDLRLIRQKLKEMNLDWK